MNKFGEMAFKRFTAARKLFCSYFLVGFFVRACVCACARFRCVVFCGEAVELMVLAFGFNEKYRTQYLTQKFN